ncbi:bacillithiol system redox-active protein YtxJ [Sporosarcina oncorhynchi]|uniref:Bacillithiol system redox-active protein YtxJ n=1 Tax=Sporosarcina oncorhynchi TaxID=3056444 RepID=A0ABZ0L5A3_9BACL|nr:bacillithiol system redox-active protein YtxJ [Sporosarcina sp. T2O-4]WOV87407.1 bacillithiol system redox-active protein YtxJ [Sporosarcina sp. T2O-4]
MKEIKSVDEWERVLDESKNGPVFMMKHSSTCPISASGYRAFEAYETDIPKNYMIVQNNKPISRAVEEDLGIPHESPQLFLVKDGKAVWNASHYNIVQTSIEKAIEVNS